jgi:hypothetical protein
MFRKKKEKERERFYLLPGQGGRALRRKQRFFLKWSLIVAFIIALILAGIMYLLNRSAW